MNGFSQLAFAQLWQVTAVILVVATLVRLFARQRPHLAHALWLVVLLKCVTPPLLSSPSGVFCWLQVSTESDVAEVVGMDHPSSQGDSSDIDQADLILPRATSDAEPYPSANQLVWQEPIDTDRRVELAPWLNQVTVDQRDSRVSDADSSTETTAAPVVEAPIDESISHDQDARLLPKAGHLRLLVCWLVGTAALATVAALRWCLFLCSLRRKGWCRDKSLELLILKLSRKLGVRRRVRLTVTFGRIGPAVIGIFRPTVLLPLVIVEGKSPKELEPILAHELMHFRRGDLWVGMLQVLAQALWWFHPLVWLVNRLVTRDAERCCDEAVIASLGCDPLRYARSLVDVLELKQTLKPVPVVPGVRPVEVTSKRLERIMTLGQGSLKRSPWWCWAVMLAATLMLLPGAAFVANAKEKSKNRHSRSRKISDRKADDLRSQTAQATKKAKDKLVTRNYPVGDVFAILQSQHDLKDEQVRELLGQEIMRVAGGHWTKPNGTDVDFVEQGNVTITDTTVIPGRATPQLWYNGKTLVVRHTREGHQRIQRHLEIERKYGYDEIEIETRLVTVDPKHLDALGIRWAMLDVDMPAQEAHPPQPSSLWQPLDRPFPEEGAKPQSHARTIVDKNTPVTQATIDNAQVKDMISAIESRDARANVLMMPKITCFNGRSVTVQDSVQRPFVVSLRRIEGDGKHEYQPRIRVVSEGITMRLRPVLLPDDKVWLDFELTMSEILGVETAQVQTGEKEPPSVQVPEVATRLVSSTLALPPGKSLIIGGLTKKGANDKPQSLLIVLRASKKTPDEAGATFVPVSALKSAGVKPRIIVQPEEEDNTVQKKPSRPSKFTQLARDLKKAVLGLDEPRDPYSADRPASGRETSARVSDHQLLDEPHYSDSATKNLMQRLDKLEWTFGVPAGASIQETKDQYRVTASPWRTTFKGEDGKLSTMFSADKGNLVVGKGDNAEITLELIGNMNWQIDGVRAFAQRGVWSNKTKRRYMLTGKVRFVDHSKQIQLTADKASFDSNRILLEGNAQIQRTTDGKTDHVTADQIEWHVDKNAFNADGTVSFHTVDTKNKTVKGEPRTGRLRLMFGVGVNSDVGVASSIVIDENVQPAFASGNLEPTLPGKTQELIDKYYDFLDQDKLAEAIAVARRAHELDPEHSGVKGIVSKLSYLRRVFPEATSSNPQSLKFGAGVSSEEGVTGQVLVGESNFELGASKSIQQLVKQFNELMDKQRHAEAIALKAKELQPDNPAVQNMLWKVEFARRILRGAKASKTLPSPYSLKDDVQYFPAGPEFKLEKEATAVHAHRDVKTNILRPLVETCERDLEPTDAEVLQALKKQRSEEKGGLAFLFDKHVKNIRIVKEKIRDYTTDAQPIPLVGLAEVHHSHFKCTVYLTETKKIGWPILHESSKDIVEVIYVDVNHIHRLDRVPHVDTSVKPENSDLPEEARIKRMLNQRIDVKYDETPLHEFAEDIGRRAGVNVYLDRRGLEAEGVTKDEPVTLKIEQPIQVSSALTLVLSPLHLKFVIEDEVVKITSRQKGYEVLSKVYNVADLVVPVPKVVHLTNDDSRFQPKTVKPDFSSLIDTIVTTIEPQSWNKAGGPGAIEGFETNLSLVVSQSEDVHEHIADLLEQMRRLYDVQVTYELRTVTMDQASYEEFWDEPLKDKANTLSPTEAFLLLQAFNDQEKITVSSGPKFTVFAWQHIIAAVDYHPDRQSAFREQLHLAPTVSADRRSLTLKWATLVDAKQFAEKKSVRKLADGETLLIDVSDQLSPAKEADPADAKQSKTRTIVLITPRVFLTEDYEASE